mmetsp:Transcript_1629/g.2508  ORF Transcript_1629/g.2508 Transcript_1629/m.2508 type:complete len:118 (+) Transcript_1629:1397-1750(+)
MLPELWVEGRLLHFVTLFLASITPLDANLIYLSNYYQQTSALFLFFISTVTFLNMSCCLVLLAAACTQFNPVHSIMEANLIFNLQVFELGVATRERQDRYKDLGHKHGAEMSGWPVW